MSHFSMNYELLTMNCHGLFLRYLVCGAYELEAVRLRSYLHDTALFKFARYYIFGERVLVGDQGEVLLPLGVFGGQDMGEQPWSGEAARNRLHGRND